MRIELVVPIVGARSLGVALAALQSLNEIILSECHDTPALYESGVFYVPEKGSERWLTIPDVLAAGRGDCEDLAAWRAAELRVSGEDDGARAVAYQSGPRLWHSVVRRGDGSVEDPSMLLGMRWHRGVLEQGDPYPHGVVRWEW